MTFWALLRSIVVVCLCAQPLALAVLGLADALVHRRIDGLFAVAAAPMTLVFFGLPCLLYSLAVIVPVYYALSWFGRRNVVPGVVFAVGAAMLLYLGVADPPPTGALPGYDQAAQGFAAVTLVAWSLHAFMRLGFRRA